MISDVAPLGGQTIGKATNREEAWWLCQRYGLKPLPMNDSSKVEMVAGENGAKVWIVPCEHTQYPYDRAAFENRRRDGLATLENGLPAWPVAEENGIAFQTFRQRLKRGWSGERAATEGVREIEPNPDDEWEVVALENGLWRAPIGWSGLIVSASWASGPSGRCFGAQAGDTPRHCAA